MFIKNSLQEQTRDAILKLINSSSIALSPKQIAENKAIKKLIYEYRVLKGVDPKRYDIYWRMINDRCNQLLKEGLIRDISDRKDQSSAGLYVKERLRAPKAVPQATLIKPSSESFKFTSESYIDYFYEYPWGMYKITMIAGNNIEALNKWMRNNNFNEALIKEWNEEVKAEGRYTKEQILKEMGIIKDYLISDPQHKIFDPEWEKEQDERLKTEHERERKFEDYEADWIEEMSK